MTDDEMRVAQAIDVELVRAGIGFVDQGVSTLIARAAIKAIGGIAQVPTWPKTEDGADEIVQPYRSYISATPELLSLLYDIDMLPEQTVTRAGAVRLAAFCEVWKRMESALSPVPSTTRGGAP